MGTDDIRITLVKNRCRWCGCTNGRKCASGCAWVTADRTLCSNCAEIDAMVRNPAGRVYIAHAVQTFVRGKERGNRGR